MSDQSSTFEEFLKRAEANRMKEFLLRIVREPDGKIGFYISPYDRQGDTADFTVIGDVVYKVNRSS